MKKHVWTILRLSVALLGAAYIAWSITWTDRVSPTGELLEPGVLTTLREANWGWLTLGLALVAVVPTLQGARWLTLMRCRGLNPGYWKSLRLTLIGMFFNFSLPGMTGGDLVKAYYAAKGSGARGTAVMSVVFDRIAGLIGLVLLAGLAGLLVRGDELVLRVTLGVWLALAALLIGGHIYLSRRVRRKLAPLGQLAKKLTPGALLMNIDATAAAYREHVPTVYGAVALSLPVHLAQMVATGLAGQALGMDVSLLLLVTVLPLVFIVGCVPISYQGLGIMEATAMALLLSPPEATANQIVGMLLIARLFIVSYALVGALLMLRGDMQMFPQQVQRAMDTDDADASSEPAGVVSGEQ